MRGALRGRFLSLLVWRGAPAAGAPPEELRFIQQRGGIAPEPGDLHAAVSVYLAGPAKAVGVKVGPGQSPGGIYSGRAH
jgi:hypothetical protein